MYSRPSTSHRCEPRARSMMSGVPPTARKARTGLFTPPMRIFSARAKSSEERGRGSCFALLASSGVRVDRVDILQSREFIVDSQELKNTLEPGETPAAERPTQFAPGFGSYRRVPTVGCRLRILSNDSTSERHLSRGKSG